jgi:uncharacterized damage-inducible protein DinB
VTPVDRSFIERNAASRRRLAAVVERLRESDMTLPTEEGGWTIAQALGHVLFWDRSMETRWRLARDASPAGGALDPAVVPHELTDAINLPLAELIGAWTGRIGIDLGPQAVAAAESLDALVIELADRLSDAVASERPNLLNRWTHRNAHLDQIEAALAAGRPEAELVDRSYVERNDASRSRLRSVLSSLTAADLAESAGEGQWTVGQVIGHMAFWDRFLAGRWRAALASGPGGQPSCLPHELADLLNDGLPATWNSFAATSADAVIAEALAAAEEIDSIIGGLPAATPIDAILAERPALLDRSIHRTSHLDQIEGVLGRQAP